MPPLPAGQRVLGVDPGLNITGYGVIESTSKGPQIVEAGVIRGTSHASLAVRVKQIYEGVCDVITSLEPHVMALEQLYSHYKQPRTAILMGHARGVICLAATQAEIEVVDYAATQIKRILTGNGRAPKAQVQRAIAVEFALREPPNPPDVADALAAALCHLHLGDRGAVA